MLGTSALSTAPPSAQPAVYYQVVTVGMGAIAQTAYVQTVSIGTGATPGMASLAIAGAAPLLTTRIIFGVGAASLPGFSPSAGFGVAVPAALLAATGAGPSLGFPANTNTGFLSLATAAPTIGFTYIVTVPPATLTLAGATPRIVPPLASQAYIAVCDFHDAGGLMFVTG